MSSISDGSTPWRHADILEQLMSPLQLPLLSDERVCALYRNTEASQDLKWAPGPWVLEHEVDVAPILRVSPVLHVQPALDRGIAALAPLLPYLPHCRTSLCLPPTGLCSPVHSTVRIADVIVCHTAQHILLGLCPAIDQQRRQTCTAARSCGNVSAIVVSRTECAN